MSEIKDKPLIIVTGPTASGKSGVGISTALLTDGEVISADSVQIYRGMDIGSAKISPDEMMGVKHHLIDKLEPDEPFNVSEFVTMAEAAVKNIYEKGKQPIVVGGTAFYIQAFLKGVAFDEETGADEAFRRDCEELFISDDKGCRLHFLNKYFADDELPQKLTDSFIVSQNPLYLLLRFKDPEYADVVHTNNRKRIIRALEYNKATGERFSLYNEREAKKGSRFFNRYFVLTDDREKLYERINKRVDKMIADGLEAEVRGLLEAGYDRNLKSMQSIGYKEMCAYINGECSLESAVDAIKQNTRHFAKRQMTWLRKEKDAIPLDVSVYDYDPQIIAKALLEYL